MVGVRAPVELSKVGNPPGKSKMIIIIVIINGNFIIALYNIQS